MKNLGEKGKISHFSMAFDENIPKLSLNGWNALDYIFFDQKFLSVTRIPEEILKIMYCEPTFQLIPQI